jgi:predicted ferric reductase
VKNVGEGTGDVHRLTPGTRVALEGPYGVFTTLRRQHPRALLIAGGIGITPLRALLEELPGGKGAVTLLYRASSWEDVIFRSGAAAVPICQRTRSRPGPCVSSFPTLIVGTSSSVAPP